jgi:hypothetical protein
VYSSEYWKPSNFELFDKNIFLTIVRHYCLSDDHLHEIDISNNVLTHTKACCICLPKNCDKFTYLGIVDMHIKEICIMEWIPSLLISASSLIFTLSIVTCLLCVWSIDELEHSLCVTAQSLHFSKPHITCWCSLP